MEESKIKNLNSRQRVMAVLNHEEPDRIPIDLGGRVSSIMEGAYLKLKNHLGVKNRIHTVSPFNSIDCFDEEILIRLGVDFRRVHLNGPEAVRIKDNPDGTYINEWGIRVRRTGPYIHRISHPLADATIDDLKNYSWPDPYQQDRIEGLQEYAKDLYEHTDYAIVADAINGGIFEYAQHLRGMDKFFMDLLVNKDFASALLDKIVEVQKGLFDIYLSAVGEYVQIILLSDDYGMQDSMLISPQLFREFIKPRNRTLIDFIKSKTRAKIMLHSDGCIYEIIEDLIEIGVDILNPCQPNVKGMEPGKLKRYFGNRLVFHGGTDQQGVLRVGNISQVNDMVRGTIKALASDCSYILAPAHLIEEDTPVENIIAMFDSAREYGQYPIKL